MAQLVQVIKKFDDGTETVHNFVSNPNAKEIEAKVAEAQAVLAGEPTGEPERPVAEVLAETFAEEVVEEEAPKKKKKKVEVEE